jgi:hypothetical protein
MEINKGPDWTAAQFTAGAIGFVASATVAHLLVSQGYATRVPPTIVRWLDVKKRQKNRVP